jgi:hypothetical protein
MKLRLEASCDESDLLAALVETKVIMNVMGLSVMDVRVTRNVKGGQESLWVSVARESHPPELVTIYYLQKQTKELQQKLTTKP